MPEPERLLSSEVVFEGDLLRVRRDRVRTPDGSDGVRECVEHPGAAAIVAVDAERRVVLVRQYRHATGETYLEVPAGLLDSGEAPEDAARRELKEETGCSSERWTPLGETHTAIGYSDERLHLFLAEDVSDGEADPDDGESVEVVRLPFDDALKQARAGEVRDAKTVVALSLAAARLDGRPGAR